jgi:UDP-glucose 4-epimerase
MTPTDFASGLGDEAIANATAIVYLTWSSVAPTFAAEPWRELNENVTPAFELFLRAAKISRDVKIVFLSSGGTVYGDSSELKSESSPTKPISPYGLGKLLAEEALSFVGRTKGNPYAILRISNAVGRWQTSETQGIVGVALRAARDGVPVRLFGDGMQVRDFVDADDVAEAIVLACRDKEHRAVLWNVGSGQGVSIANLMTILPQIVGRPVQIERAAARSFDVPHVVLDCRKLEHDLGWAATTPLNDSISRLWWAVRQDKLALSG